MAKSDGSITIETSVDSDGVKAGVVKIEASLKNMAKRIDSLGDTAKIAIQKQLTSFQKLDEQYSKQQDKVQSLEDELKKLSKEKIKTEVFSNLEKELDVAEKKLDRFYAKMRQEEKLSDGHLAQGDIQAKIGKRDTLINKKSENEKILEKMPNKTLMDADARHPYVNEIKEAEAEIQKLTEEINKAEAANAKLDKSSTYINAKRGVSDYEEKVKDLRTELQSMEDSGDAYEKIDTSGIESKLATEKQKLTEMSSSIKTSFENIVDQFDKAVEESAKLKAIGQNAEVSRGDIINLRKELEKLQERQKLLSSAGVGLGHTEYDQNTVKIKQMSQELREYEAELLNVSVEENEVSASEERGISVKNILQKAYKKLGQLAMKALSAIAAGAKNAARRLISMNKSTKKCRMSLGKMLATSLLMSTVFRAFSTVTSGIQTGFQNLAQYSKGVNKDISMLMSSLTQLKNSFATAFAPILSVVAPVLNQLINMLSKAITYVGMFIAALTGKKTFTKAVAVQEDYAASLNNTASSAKDAAKAMDSYLSPLDDINRMESKDTSSGNSGGYQAPSAGSMFEEVPINSSIADMADEIKKLIAAQDWDGLGDLAAGKLNSVFKKIDEAINWNKVGGKITKFMNGLTTFFNALVNKFDWNGLGKTIADGVNTIIYTLNLLLTGIDWVNLGMALATGLMGLVTNVDWTALGQLLGNSFMLSWKLFLGFVSNLDFAQVGLAIGNGINGFLQTFDLATILTGIVNFVVGILTALTTAIQTTDWTLVGQQIADALAAIDWGALATGLFDAGTALLEGLFQAFGELPGSVQGASAAVLGFFAVFKGASLVSSLTPIISTLSTVLSNPFVLAIGAAVAAIVVLVKYGDEIKEALQKLADWIGSIFLRDWSQYFGALGDIINGLMASLSQVFGGIKTILFGIIDFIKGVFTGDWKRAWEGIKQIFSGIWQALIGIVKAPINIIIGLLNGLIKGFVGALNAVIGVLNKFHFEVPDWVPLIGGKSIGFNIAYKTAPQIPYLASGAVIPPNAPFMAMLGDQKNGTNIETPEKLLRQIIREELGTNNTSGGKTEYTFIGQINRRTLFEEFITEAKLRQRQTGKNPLELT